MIFNNKKVIFLVISLFLLTGCTVHYNLSINYNNIIEYVVLQNSDVAISDDMFSTINDDYGIYYNIDYDFDPEECLESTCPTYIDDSFGASHIYSSFEEYCESKVIKDFFGDFKVSQNNTVYFLTATPNTQLKGILEDVNYIKAPVDEILINILVPYKVIESNADQVNGNTYTWTYNKDNLDKVLTISYTTDGDSGQIVDNDFNNNVNNNVDNNTSNNQGNKTINSSNYVFWIILFGILIVVGVFVLKKMKNNDSV